MITSEFLKKLEETGATFTTEVDGDYVQVTVDLGTGFAGAYKGGYWEDCAITNDQLAVVFEVADNYWGTSEFAVGEGKVFLNYVDFPNTGLAYTSELNSKINARIEEVTKGFISASGSEQGMQGMDSAEEAYLSLDLDY